MRFLTMTTYGVKAMVDLALHEGQGPTPVAAIAKRQGIPVLSLGQVLHRLRRGGLVVAERGARGGYQLARAPERISVADVTQVFEAKPARGTRTGTRAPEAGAAVQRATGLLWTRMEGAIATALGTTTLAELAAEARRQQTDDAVHHTFTFHI